MFKSRSHIVAYYTFREILKSKILVNTIFIGVCLSILTFVAYSFSYGSPARIALDFGVGALSLSTVAIALFFGTSLISDEVNSRTIYLVISRPISRVDFLLGKIVGLSSILFLNTLILSVFTLSLYFFIGGVYQNLIFWSILFICVEGIIILLLACLFSLLSNKVLSILTTIGLYIVGHAINSTQLISFVKENYLLSKILEMYHFILPAFYKFNLKDYLLYEQTLSNKYLYINFAYGLIYILALLSIMTIVFNKKNLD